MSGYLNATASYLEKLTNGLNLSASGFYSHAEGYQTTASGYASHAEGYVAVSAGSSSHAEGGYTFASGSYSHAEGGYATASGLYSHVEGYNTIASGSYSHAEGQLTIASGQASHAEGLSTTSSGQSSHAEGHYTLALGLISHAEGGYTTSSGQYSHAEGQYTLASGVSSHAEGQSVTARGQSSHAEGTGSVSSGSSSHAEGYYTLTSGVSSHAEGLSTTASADYQHVSGKFNVTSSNSNNLFIIGNGTSAVSRSNILVVDTGSVTVNGNVSASTVVATSMTSPSVNFANLTASNVSASGFVSASTVRAVSSMTSPSGNFTNLTASNISASGNVSASTINAVTSMTSPSGNITNLTSSNVSASGFVSASTVRAVTSMTSPSGNFTNITASNISASGFVSASKLISTNTLSNGDGVVASGDYSHAEGRETFASGGWSHAEGYRTSASGQNSHAEGESTRASGSYSHAEGYGAIASGISAHAEGIYTLASGNYSHAEGHYYVTASGTGSHAEGTDTKALGNHSHAEGGGSVSAGGGSHAEGLHTLASGSYSHAEGLSTTASADYQHVSGKFNVTSSNSNDLFIIGNGSATNARSNIVVVNTSSVTVGGTIAGDTIACNEFLTSNGTFQFTSPYVGTLDLTSQQVSESAVISMTTADGKIAGLAHYSAGHTKGQLLDIFAQPGLQISLSPNGTESVRINTTGKVGIGTSYPVQPLDIYGGNGTGVTNEGYGLRIRGASVDGNSATIQLGANSTLYSYIQSAYWGGGYTLPLLLNPNGSKIYLNTDYTGYSTNNTVVSLVTGGDILIKGTGSVNAPSQMGRIGFSEALGPYGTTGAFPAFIGGYKDHSAANFAGGMGLTFNTISGSDVSSTSGLERMRISSTGLVGIGTTSPTGMVHIKSNASDTVSLFIAGAVSQTANFLEMRNSSNVLWASYRRPEATDPGAGAYIGLKNRIYDVSGTYYMDLYQSNLYSTIAPSSYFVIHSGNTNNTSSLILRTSTDVVWNISGQDGSGDIYPGYDYTNLRGPRIYAGSRFGFFINSANNKQDWVKDDRINSTNGRVMFMAQVAGADTDICSMSGDGLNLQSGKALYNDGNKVVGARGAAVANATDLESALTQLNALLARLRAHGLISE